MGGGAALALLPGAPPPLLVDDPPREDGELGDAPEVREGEAVSPAVFILFRALGLGFGFRLLLALVRWAVALLLPCTPRSIAMGLLRL